MAKEAPSSGASRRPLAGPGPLFGPGRVAPRGLGTLGTFGSPPEEEAEAPSFEIGSDVQVLSQAGGRSLRRLHLCFAVQGQWKIGTVLAETASGFLVLTDMEQLEVPAAEVRRPFSTPARAPIALRASAEHRSERRGEITRAGTSSCLTGQNKQQSSQQPLLP